LNFNIERQHNKEIIVASVQENKITMTTTTSAADAATRASLSYLRPEVAALQTKLQAFVNDECIPAEVEYDAHMQQRHGKDRWIMEAVPPCIERLQQRAQALGLWNLFLPPHLIAKIPPAWSSWAAPSVVLHYREYGILCETLGRSPWIAPAATNTNAPDTGNMEVLLEFGTPLQKERYLKPLLQGTIRSTFLMTEPEVASSDPTNLQAKLVKSLNAQGQVEYELSGTKWWSTGAMDPRCRVALVVARLEDTTTNPADTTQTTHRHGAHTIVAVPLPHPGACVERALTVMGYDDAPHGHAVVRLQSVRLTPDDLIGGEGSGFRVSQARLGPGRIHHCMRAVGMGKFRYCYMFESIAVLSYC
jgi:acyl-CoA dehydrogenase